MSVCGVTEDYKENFEKAVLQKRKEQVFNIHQQHFRITVFLYVTSTFTQMFEGYSFLGACESR